MQNIYLYTFNAIYKITRHLSKSARNLVIFACFILLMWIYFFSSMDVVSKKTQIVGSALTIIITVFSVNKPCTIVKWNKAVYYSMSLFGVGIIIINMIHPVGEGYVVYALDLIVFFPAFYFVWTNRRDYRTLYRLLSSAIMFLGVASFAYCFFLALKGELLIQGYRVAGLRANANTFGRLGVVIIVTSIFLIWTSMDKTIVLISASAGLGIGLSYLLLSSSRTSFLSTIACLTIFVIRWIMDKKDNMSMKSILMTLGVVVLSLVVMQMGLQLNDINYQAVKVNKELSASENDNTIKEETSKEKVHEGSNIDEIGKITERMKSYKDANTFSSGRIKIWKIYWENTKLLGSEYSTISDHFPTRKGYWAHNNILEYFFRCGYIVGGLYAIFFIAQGLSGLKMLFNRRFSGPCAYFAVSAIAMYSLLAMLDVAILPFAGGFPAIYFLSIAPIMISAKQ